MRRMFKSEGQLRDKATALSKQIVIRTYRNGNSVDTRRNCTKKGRRDNLQSRLRRVAWTELERKDARKRGYDASHYRYGGVHNQSVFAELQRL